jgi:hypothetical protein
MKIQSAMATAAASLSLVACAAGPETQMFSQNNLPDAVKVPPGHKVALETVGVGQITYQCRADKDMAGKFAWVFAGPDARLLDRTGKQVGKYYGPPATWEAMDGSKFDGKQIAVAPGGAGNIPFQLVRANAAMGSGAMSDVTYVQRSATKGGVAPGLACGAANLDAKAVVNYQADYVFYKAS